jgi:hypothetical protein
VDDWCWRGPTAGMDEWAERLAAPGLVTRARRLADRRGG